MDKRLSWTEKHWKCIEVLMKENGMMPWYAVQYQLTMSGPNINARIADEVIRAKIKDGRIEVVKRGNSGKSYGRKRGGSFYLRLFDPTPRKMTTADMDELRRMK